MMAPKATALLGFRLTVLLAALLTTGCAGYIPSIGTGYSDADGDNTPDQAEPVYQRMCAESWIHCDNPDPVYQKMRKQSWIHDDDPDPVKAKMCADSWIHC